MFRIADSKILLPRKPLLVTKGPHTNLGLVSHMLSTQLAE